MIKRYNKNPIINTSDIKPSNENLEVIGAFNCGATLFNDEVILLIRVAEKVKSNNDELIVPYYYDGKLNYKTYNKNDTNYNFTDERVIRDKEGVIVNLTSLSHFRIARSKDFYNFEIDLEPTIIPMGIYEEWGIEDPRITKIDNEYLITYSSISKYGVTTSLIKTINFINYQRFGVIFSPDNKDVSIFPEKINNKYYCYHRPVQKDIGKPNMWVASSDDLISWGNTNVLLTTEDINWGDGRVGGGAPSIKTKYGWLHIFHAASINDKYQLGAFLTKLDDPKTITHLLNAPILSPEEEYETKGFFNDVVFTNGIVEKDNYLYIYYGAADERVAVALININELLNELQKNEV